MRYCMCSRHSNKTWLCWNTSKEMTQKLCYQVMKALCLRKFHLQAYKLQTQAWSHFWHKSMSHGIYVFFKEEKADTTHLLVASLPAIGSVLKARAVALVIANKPNHSYRGLFALWYEYIYFSITIKIMSNNLKSFIIYLRIKWIIYVCSPWQESMVEISIGFLGINSMVNLFIVVSMLILNLGSEEILIIN